MGVTDDPIVVAATPKKFGDMTEAERADLNMAFVQSMHEQFPTPVVPINFDTDEDPVDQLDPDEVRELYSLLADDYLGVASVLVPPDLTPEAEIRARYAAFAEERIAARLPVRTGVMVVREHGEIGPVLTRKGQEFTGPSRKGA